MPVNGKVNALRQHCEYAAAVELLWISERLYSCVFLGIILPVKIRLNAAATNNLLANRFRN